MMRLRELQRAFQEHVLYADDSITPELNDASADDAVARLEVYVSGYRTRLVEALGTTYPVLKTTLGDAEFERQMRSYIECAPSCHYSVRYHGADVARRLEAADDSAGGCGLAELARWEWTLADVFDAADDQPLSVDSLSEVPPSAWPTLSFVPRACVRRFDTRTNAVQWWRAANGLCARPESLGHAMPGRWVLWRRGMKTMFRSLEPIEADLLDQARAGATFEVLCEQLVQEGDATTVALRAASLLRGWIAEELIADLAPY